jgi:hypothetical protein
LWCLQNEDATTWTPASRNSTRSPPLLTDAVTTILPFNTAKCFSRLRIHPVTLTVLPRWCEASLHGDMVWLDPILYGNAHAFDIPTGAPVTLNLQDPDSLTVDPRGNIVLNSQADSKLIFIQNAMSNKRLVGVLNITSPGAASTTLDDTAFAPDPHAYMLFSDVNGDTIYKIDNRQFGFEPGTAYSTSDTLGFVGQLNLDNGVVTPIATGFGSTRGLIFVPSNSGKNED